MKFIAYFAVNFINIAICAVDIMDEGRQEDIRAHSDLSDCFLNYTCLLIHGIAMLRSTRNLLNGIPMLTYFTFIIEPKKIHGHIFIIIRPNLVRM